MRVAILDDYQQVSLASADWSAVRSLAEIDVFAGHMAGTEELARALEPYDVIVAMRERTFFDAPRLSQLPQLVLRGTPGCRTRRSTWPRRRPRGLPYAAPAAWARRPRS